MSKWEALERWLRRRMRRWDSYTKRWLQAGGHQGALAIVPATRTQEIELILEHMATMLRSRKRRSRALRRQGRPHE